ncbi:DUF3592 domain-containing protein [uncultured Pseudomonas sp.]|uniref:DUF3592 domain-containing protein n=1 Tax=uncultured Pseudomonas sp. TaxID=114707 RepID=UPI0025DD2DF9|nr:DUF3592 domain-containing protein [uncultured Pseudomonas sp.]
MAKTPLASRGNFLRALLFLPLGLCLLYLTFWLVEERLDFIAHAQRAEGHVSALNAGGSHPQIDFATASGDTFSYPESGLIFGYSVGNPVAVLYRAESPAATAIIDDRGALWGASLLSGLFALVSLSGGVYHAVAWIRERRRAQSA